MTSLNGLEVLIDRPLPAPFTRTTICIPIGHRYPYDENQWHNALVLIRQGTIRIETKTATVYCFPAGDVVYFTGLDIQHLVSVGCDDAVLTAIRRRP